MGILFTPLGLIFWYFFIYGIVAFIKDFKKKRDDDKKFREEQKEILKYLQKRDNSEKRE